MSANGLKLNSNETPSLPLALLDHANSFADVLKSTILKQDSEKLELLQKENPSEFESARCVALDVYVDAFVDQNDELMEFLKSRFSDALNSCPLVFDPSKLFVGEVEFESLSPTPSEFRSARSKALEKCNRYRSLFSASELSKNQKTYFIGRKQNKKMGFVRSKYVCVPETEPQACTRGLQRLECRASIEIRQLSSRWLPMR